MFSQFLSYLLAGALTTSVDFCVYNFLAGRPIRLGRVPAHLISTLVAMFFGFTLHLVLVFHPAELLLSSRVPKYILTVCCSAYLLQTLVIQLLSAWWRMPAQLARGVVGRLDGWSLIEGDFVERNFVKACAVLSGLVFNFVSFKWFVYA